MGMKKTPASDRFWKKVDVKSKDECWEWTGSKYYNGYGQFFENPNKITAHRFSYELANGKINDKKLLVCHKCDNRGCVNPNHLFLGTHKENLQDMYNKGRQNNPSPIGEKNPNVVVTEKEVKQIRKIYAKGGISYKKLGEKFGISETQTTRIVKKESWKHVK